MRPSGGWARVEELYARYSRAVYRRARQLLADDAAARDATQDVFVRVMRAGGSAPSDPTPTAWLHRITTNLCLNRLRDGNLRRSLLAAHHTPELEATVPARAESRTVVLEILARLPDELQEIAVYFFVDEMTYGEIAELVGVSPRTVSSRLAAFRELVSKQFPDARFAS